MTDARPRLLDLFCGAGGAAMGYHRAGFEVVGVDISPQPRYPFRFLMGDALSVSYSHRTGHWRLDDENYRIPLGVFDLIHASPPCQRWSDLAHRNGNGGEWPDLIEPIRRRLESTGVDYVIENVERAPLRDPIVLCGTMFPGLRVLRHRLFESSVPLEAPPHGLHPLCYTRDKRKAHNGRLDEMSAFVTVTGGGNCSVRAASDAMGLEGLTKAELNEAIPPAYTELVGGQIMAARLAR